MVIHKDLTIQLKEPQIKQLKGHYRQVIRHLEEGFPLKMKVLEALKNDLSGIINQSPQWQKVLHAIHDGNDFYCIRLMHSDNEILNLPWSMAVDNKSNKQLGNMERLYLTKSIPRCFEEKGTDLSKAPAPLKILVMISSPEDTEWKHRLSYEEEEYAILEAFEPLMQQGAVKVDFTEDGSLEALERKLKTNKYHILHFSGHAIFREKDKTGYLQLEDSLTLKTHLAAAEDFASAVNCHPQHKVPLVMLASCQTAQGNTEEGLRGVTNHLLRQGVPVVISMGMAVEDKYAALFSAYFYRELAEKKTIFSAFNEAIDYLRNREHNDREKKPGSREIPLQWIIPNLYLSRHMEEVVGWKQPQEELKFSSQRYIFGQERLLLPHEKDYRFIGRRKDKAEILGPFFERVPILLKGQGGVGKTAMAEHLVQRLIAKEPKTVPFLFNEYTHSIKEILDRLQDFLIHQGNDHVIANVNQYEKAMDKFQCMLFQIKESHQTVFVFDNLEGFQAAPGEDFAEEYSDIKEVIEFLCNRRICYLILTCRYPVPGLKNLRSFDLNQVGFTDFWKKCIYMDVGDIHIHLREMESFEKAQQGFLASPGLQYINVVKLLHETFGGNYRALNFFDRLLKERPDKINDSLDSLEKFRESIKEATNEAKQQMGQNLVFAQLMELLESEHQKVLKLLSHFRIPVQAFALQLQVQEKQDSIDWLEILENLIRLTLIEWSQDREIQSVYYYVTPIVKDLLEGFGKAGQLLSFSHKQAGIYYYHICQNVIKDLTFLEEAFYHFDKAGDKEKVQEIGDNLSNFYYKYSMYNNAFFYAQRTYQLLGDQTRSRILNVLGAIYKFFGEYDNALVFCKKALAKVRGDGSKVDEGTILFNIGQFYSALSNHDTALGYFEQSLDISHRENNTRLEAVTLSHISQIHSIRGDNDTAIKYLEQSLVATRVIGDKLVEAMTLNELGSISLSRSEYESALEHFEQSLKISQEIYNKSLEGTVLNNISLVYSARGDYVNALRYLEKDLKICQDLGDRPGEAVTLNNISQIYAALGDYETNFKYLKRCQKILQDIGDKLNEARILHNISQIYIVRGDYKTALKNLEDSLKISKELGSKLMEGTTSNAIGQLYSTFGDNKKALMYLNESLKINQDIGNKSGEATNLSNIGLIYSASGDYVSALKNFKKVLEIDCEIGDKEGEGTTLNNIGLAYSYLDDINTAFKYFEKSLKISQDTGNKSGEGLALINLGSCSYACGDYERSLAYLELSIKINQEIGDIKQIIAIKHNMANIALEKGDIEKFMEYESWAYKLAVEINDAERIYHIGKFFGEILYNGGMRKEGIAILNKCYDIGKTAGYSDLKKIEDFLKKIGEL